MSSDLVLDDQHRYWVRNRQYPSVTQILSALNLTDYSAPWFSEKARQRGQVFHACCELINNNDLDWDSVDPSVLFQVQAYLAWKKETKFTATFSEKKMYSMILGFAGTVDMIGSFGGTEGIVLIDLKHGLSAAAVAYQLAMYALLFCDGKRNIFPFQIRRFSLEGFRGGKKPKMIEHSKRIDIDAAKSILNVYHDGFRKGIYYYKEEKNGK